METATASVTLTPEERLMLNGALRGLADPDDKAEVFRLVQHMTRSHERDSWDRGYAAGLAVDPLSAHKDWYGPTPSNPYAG